MTTDLMVTIDGVRLTEAQVERAAKELAEQKRRAACLCVGGRNNGGNYLNIPRDLLERLLAVVQRNDAAYGCLYPNGTIGFNRTNEADTSRPLARFTTEL